MSPTVASESTCRGVSVVVNSQRPATDYDIEVLLNPATGDCSLEDYEQMLLGSGQQWRSQCTEEVRHSINIRPLVQCSQTGEDWTVESLQFKLKADDRRVQQDVGIYVEDKTVLSVSCTVESVLTKLDSQSSIKHCYVYSHRHAYQ